MIKKFCNTALCLLMAIFCAVPVSFHTSYATTAQHYLGTGAGGADYCTVWNYPYNMYTQFGPSVSNHFLYYDGDSHDAFCLNPYLSGGNNYTEGTFNGEWYAADYEAALKYIAMYNEGYPTGFDDRVRKLAVQMAIFNTSQMGEDYAPPNKAAYWYSLMFNGSEYYNALLTLWYQAESYTMPQTGALLGTPQNITHVHLTLNNTSNRYEATVNAGANAQYYTWNGYASRTGNYIKFSVPANDVLNWTEKYNGCPAYTSAPITGRGTNTWAMNPTLWTSSADAQQMLTMDYEIVTPTNTIQYSIYVDGIDEGRPGGGGGLYGGSISQTSAVAGGGSGYIGSDTNNSSMTAGDTASLPPDGSSDGYARITLIS